MREPNSVAAAVNNWQAAAESGIGPCVLRDGGSGNHRVRATANEPSATTIKRSEAVARMNALGPDAGSPDLMRTG